MSSHCRALKSALYFIACRLVARNNTTKFPRLLTLDEAASRLRVSRRTAARQLNADGPLSQIGVKVGNQWRFREDALEALVTPHSVTAPHEAVRRGA